MKKIIILTTVVILLLGGITAFYVSNNANNITHEKTISKEKKNVLPKKLSKTAAKKINDEFYSHEIIKVGGSSSFVGEYPSTFSKLINNSELTVNGEIVGLKSYIYNNMPFTIVSLRIDNVLKGTDKRNKIIHVMFLGGNITRKEDAASRNSKVPEGTDPNEIITLEFTLLPRAGEKVALGLSKIPKGVNGTHEEFWSTTYAEKSTFFQDSDGKYRRVSETPPIADDGTRDLSGLKEDELMNNGMNDLIDKIQHKTKSNSIN